MDNNAALLQMIGNLYATIIDLQTQLDVAVAERDQARTALDGLHATPASEPAPGAIPSPD